VKCKTENAKREKFRKDDHAIKFGAIEIKGNMFCFSKNAFAFSR
jgi:hypothetical protein